MSRKLFWYPLVLKSKCCHPVQDALHGFVEPFWIIVEDGDSEYVLHHEFFLLKKQYMDEDHTVAFTVPISEPLPPQYFIKVSSTPMLTSHPQLISQYNPFFGSISPSRRSFLHASKQEIQLCSISVRT